MTSRTRMWERVTPREAKEMVRRVLSGEGIKAVAAHFGRTEGTVRVHLHRAGWPAWRLKQLRTRAALPLSLRGHT